MKLFAFFLISAVCPFAGFLKDISMVATGTVLSVTERFDDKHGSYSCYRIDFGKLDNGEHDIQTIPFRFVEKIKSPKASP